MLDKNSLFLSAKQPKFYFIESPIIMTLCVVFDVFLFNQT